MNLDEAILKRRSVRKFTDEEVNDSDIKKILETASWAPSWANTQVWEFVVVRDKEKIEKVVNTFSEKNPAYNGALKSSALIVACAQKGISGNKGGKEVTKFSNWFMFDLGLACQNLCLKAHSLGLGTVIVSLMDHAQCQKIIELPENYEVVAVIPLGKPLVPDKNPPPRKELASFTHLNKFNNPFLQN